MKSLSSTFSSPAWKYGMSEPFCLMSWTLSGFHHGWLGILEAAWPRFWWGKKRRNVWRLPSVCCGLFGRRLTEQCSKMKTFLQRGRLTLCIFSMVLVSVGVGGFFECKKLFLMVRSYLVFFFFFFGFGGWSFCFLVSGIGGGGLCILSWVVFQPLLMNSLLI